jgi:hypothetical protein
MTIKVPQSQIEKAWENWLEFHYGLDGDACTQRFCDFVDPGDINEAVIDPWHDHIGEVEVLPEIAARINMLSGPHFHAVIKAHYALHPWK